MDNLFNKVSELLDNSLRLTSHSSLTQNLINDHKSILWNDEPSSIDSLIYIELKNALKKRGSSFYTRSDILPYQDFCIALLSSSNYSLNHNTISSISDRSYTAAWRAINVVRDTANTDVSQWIDKYINGRTPTGYCNALGISVRRESNRLSNTSNSLPNYICSKDEYTLSSISIDELVVKIPYYSDNGNSKLCIFQSTYTPEGQLDDLRIFAKFSNAS